MDTSLDTLSLIAQFGLPAVMLWVVWQAYQKLVPLLLDVIRQNSAAMQQNSVTMATVVEAVKDNTAAQQQTMAVVTNMDLRLARLEEQHSQNGRTEGGR